MMHDVVQEHLAIGQEPRPLEDRFALKRQLPLIGPCRVRRVLERTSNFRRALIEGSDELRSRLERQRRVALLGEVQARSGQDGQSEAAEFGDMRRQPPERHGLGVRHEVRFAGWNALERRAGLLHFFVEFRQQQITDWHMASGFEYYFIAVALRGIGPANTKL